MTQQEKIVKTFGNELAMHLTPSNEVMKAVRFAREALTDVLASLTEAHKVEMEKAQKEIDHLSNYAQHDIRCITQFEEDEECDCGLIDIKK
jgi:hypothetical protein